MDETMGIEQARPQLGEIIDRARLAGDHVTISRHGKPAAVIVPVEWYEETVTALGLRDAG